MISSGPGAVPPEQARQREEVVGVRHAVDRPGPCVQRLTAKVPAERAQPPLLVWAEPVLAPVAGAKRLVQRRRRDLRGVHSILDSLARQGIDLSGGVAHDEAVRAVAPRHASEAERRGLHPVDLRVGAEHRAHFGIDLDTSHS